jgi:hypothetical protein
MSLKHVDWEVPAFGELTGGAQTWPSYDELVTSLAPIAYWRFDESTSDTIHDGAGAYDGSYDAAIREQPGALARDVNGSVALAGSERFGTVPNPLQGLTAFSIAIWIFANQYTIKWQTVFNSTPQKNDGIVLQRNRTGNSLQFGVRTADADGGIMHHCEASTSVLDSQWHFAVVTAEAGAASQLYLDGALADSEGLASISSLPATITLGTDMYFDRPWDGRIDEAAVWDRVLSSSEIVRLYHRGRGHFQLGA